jgi:hypothetical protein
MILSASRRTDIPAFYGDWFMEKLREKSALVKNPMNPQQVSKIDLDPANIECIVFWTKNPKKFLEHLKEIDDLGYHYYFQFTLNPYGNDIETNLEEKDKIVNTFMKLSNLIGKKKVIWRYDPVIINGKYTLGYHEANYGALYEKLSNYTEKCVISFIDEYFFLKDEFKKLHIHELNDEEIEKVSALIASVVNSSETKLTIASCSEKALLTQYGIIRNKCVDETLINELFNLNIKYKKDRGQRQECACAQSRDIGAYNTCNHGCIYCYAQRANKR